MRKTTLMRSILHIAAAAAPVVIAIGVIAFSWYVTKPFAAIRPLAAISITDRQAVQMPERVIWRDASGASLTEVETERTLCYVLLTPSSDRRMSGAVSCYPRNSRR